MDFFVFTKDNNINTCQFSVCVSTIYEYLNKYTYNNDGLLYRVVHYICSFVLFNNFFPISYF